MATQTATISQIDGLSEAQAGIRDEIKTLRGLTDIALKRIEDKADANQTGIAGQVEVMKAQLDLDCPKTADSK